MRFFDTALTQPGLQKQGIAYNAACCAGALARGEATDERTTDADGRAVLRAKALEWLTIAISDMEKSLTDQHSPSADIESNLLHWKSDADLASVRDEKPLSTLPEPEQAQWRAFWKRVDESLNKTKQVNRINSFLPPRKL